MGVGLTPHHRGQRYHCPSRSSVAAASPPRSGASFRCCLIRTTNREEGSRRRLRNHRDGAVAVDSRRGLAGDETLPGEGCRGHIRYGIVVILVSATLRCQPSSVSADWVTSATGSGSAAATPSPRQRRTTTSAPARRILSTNTRL